jgi:opacity protein-like surface antigen
MKKLIQALAVSLALCSSASAATFVAEYDYNNVNGDKAYTHTQYMYFGIIVPISDGKYGAVDFGLQGARAYTEGYTADGQNGWELGYSYMFSEGKVNFIPRIAYGAMNLIDPAGAGFRLNAKYWLASIEANTPFNKAVGGYVSYSYMYGANTDSINHVNRGQIGLDFFVSKDFTIRTGYSYQKFGPDYLSGVLLVGSYSF